MDADLVEQMMGRLHHRGPDDEGVYVDTNVALGHTRLSIIDLSTGKQPLSNEDRTVWIVFNGEIYNFKSLKQDLLARGHVFATNTDTEVIVHLYEEYGEECLQHLRGMFAFGLWDTRKRKLLLARDRVGIKPLYYFMTNETLIFASEIKALIVDPIVKREVDPQAVAKFLAFSYTPGFETLLRNIWKLEPGHYLVSQHGRVQVKQYWDLEFSTAPRNGNFDAAVDELIELLRETVRDHMISDVPVGVLLSGGVDSSALLSFIVEETGQNVSTFTIGFEGEKFADERYYARLVASSFGNKHHEMSIKADDFLAFLPKYVWHMEEPVCEPPAVALYYLTRLAKEHVKVLISGEGGDEAFAGYQTYRNLVCLERLKKASSPWTRAIAARLIGRLASLPHMANFERYSHLMTIPLQDYYYSRSSSPLSFFNRSRAHFYSKSFQEKAHPDCATECVIRLFAGLRGHDALSQMLYIDTKTWLPDDLLIKADKMTMANSLELRVPLLDHKVLEFAARLPENYKLRGFTTKFILKKAFDHRVPKEVLKRKKTGFPIPIETWLNNDLRNFAHELLTDRKTLERGYFNKKAIYELLSNPSPTWDSTAAVFSLIILELWHRCFADSAN